MAFRHGSKASIKVNAVDLSVYLDTIDLDVKNDQADTSVFTNTWHQSISGLNGADCTLSGNYDPTASTGPAAVLFPLIGGAAVAILYYPGGILTGQDQHSFSAFVTGYKTTSKATDKVTFTATLKATGADTYTIQ